MAHTLRAFGSDEASLQLVVIAQLIKNHRFSLGRESGLLKSNPLPTATAGSISLQDLQNLWLLGAAALVAGVWSVGGLVLFFSISYANRLDPPSEKLAATKVLQFPIGSECYLSWVAAR